MRASIRFLASVAASAVASVVFLDASTVLLHGAQKPDSQWVADALRRKSAIASAATGPQVLLAGGSNVNYGYSAELLAREGRTSATNLAVHAGLGRGYIFRHCLGVARRGDLVVLALEYPLYAKPFMDKAEREQAFLHERDYYEALPLPDRLALLGSVSPGHWSELWQAWAGIAPGNRRGDPVVLNTHGDQTDNDRSGMPVYRSPDVPNAVDPAFSDELRTFATTLRSRGAEVVVAYPNLRRSAFFRRAQPAFFAELRRAAEGAGVRIIGTAEEAAFADADAYDTEYHLNASGTRTATRRLLRDLRQAGFALPERPPG